MAKIITTLHPEGSKKDNLYPNVVKENIPVEAIDLTKLDVDVKNKFITLDNKIGNLHSLQPSIVTTLNNILLLTENKGIAIATDTGHWYYWGRDTYLDGGVYQSTEVGDGTITPYKTNFFDIDISENLFNKDSALNHIGYYMQFESQLIPLSGSIVSHPILLKPNTTYSFGISAGYYGENANIIRNCDENGNLISNGFIATKYGSYATFTNIDKPKYVCFNVRQSTINNIMFVEGSVYPSVYKPYYEPNIKIKPEYLNIPSNDNVLNGKKIALIGDSICYGDGYVGGYGKMISEENNMLYSNIAQSGGTLAINTKYAGGSDRYWISDHIKDMPNDADYYIVEGGVNDNSLPVELGEITPDYTSKFNKETLCGALESICKELQTNFIGKKYGFIFAHNVFNYNNKWTTTWRPKMKEILNKWGIPYLDLSDLCVQIRNIDSLRIYTDNNDGWHPTEEGYRLLYVPKITAWLKTL